jgi:hypothetical protein
MIKQIQYKKVSGGFFRFNGKIIENGMVFSALTGEIPKAFLDMFQVVETPEEEVEMVVQIPQRKPKYSAKPRKGEKGIFDVFDSKGKQVNEAGLSKDEADELIKNL